jgi:large subunit ribosomal protein L28
MARICEFCGKHSVKGHYILRSGKAKKEGGIGTHVTAMTKRRFQPNLQRVKALVNGTVRHVNVCTGCMKVGRVTRVPLRTWKPEVKPEVKAA